MHRRDWKPILFFAFATAFLWGGAAQAQLAGGYWLIELQAKSGYRLRYAISARDGSIRERAMVQ